MDGREAWLRMWLLDSRQDSTDEGLLSDERAKVLMSWDHNRRFSGDDSVRFEPEAR